jgi:copper homeostasis protein
MPLKVEVCVQGVASALAAEMGGADRVELCEDLAVGGVTPSAGAIAVTCSRLTIPVHVLIRPRAGDFAYEGDEYEVMCRDVEAARELGARGVVTGVLSARNTLDHRRTARLVAIARPMTVTFHRAFDEVPDVFETLDALIELGVERVLTSGSAPSARQGLYLLSRLQEHAGDRIVILAGGRVRLDDLQALASAGLREVHCGSAAGPAGRTDPDRVAQLVSVARGL